jgi:flagellar biosynthetic protein FliR
VNALNPFDAITAHVAPAMLVVFRIGGLMVYGPIFGAPIVPGRVKVLLSVVIGLAIYPVLPVAAIPAELKLDLWVLAPLVALELLIGLTIGFAANMPLLAVQTGSRVMGQQMGLGFARLYNPAMEADADILGQMLFFMALAGFLLIGGHESMVLAVMNSFHHVPTGAFVLDESVIGLLLGLLAAAFELALRIAMPLLAVIALESAAMGFLAKTVPQLNILSLGFPLRILVGLTTVAIGLVVIDEVVMEGISETLEIVLNWVESLGRSH